MPAEVINFHLARAQHFERRARRVLAEAKREAGIVDLEVAKGERIAELERRRAFEVAVTHDGLIVPFCEQTLTPTQAIEFAEMIKARALEAFR